MGCQRGHPQALTVTAPSAATPFRVAIAGSALDDLRRRLAATRWPEAETVDDDSQGARLSFVRDLCDRWTSGYDWRDTERRINSFDQFRAGVDGLDLHFLHARSPHADALPLLLLHGWPGSVVEFLDVIEPLTSPESGSDAFHVVCPSLPGYGFSGRPTEPGWGTERTARALDALMMALGYDRYGAQGGDWGARIARQLGTDFADRVVGTHLNFVMVDTPDDPGELTAAERAGLERSAELDRWGRGYIAQQSTRPQTLGYGLNDSPAGLAAWIAEKLVDWSDRRGPGGAGLTMDRMLDDISVYWFTQTATSAARLYWEAFGDPPAVPPGPVGCSIFPYELRRPSRRWAERVFPDLRYWNEPERGGHFAAWEQPDLFVDEVRSFFTLVR